MLLSACQASGVTSLKTLEHAQPLRPNERVREGFKSVQAGSLATESWHLSPWLSSAGRICMSQFCMFAVFTCSCKTLNPLSQKRRGFLDPMHGWTPAQSPGCQESAACEEAPIGDNRNQQLQKLLCRTVSVRYENMKGNNNAETDIHFVSASMCAPM